jgi:phosphotransferase system enzyme I (PtsP)
MSKTDATIGVEAIMTERTSGHIDFLCSIGELNWVYADSVNIDAFLSKIVEMVAAHFQAQVCSVYLYDENRRELTLKATRGLNPDLTGVVRLKLGDGLTGLAVKEMRPICERQASSHPNYRFFDGLMEERYESFLAAPIVRGIQRIGALVVQRDQKRPFAQSDIGALRAVANQLANSIENARMLISLQQARSRPKRRTNRRLPTLLKGKVANAGFALGSVIFADRQRALNDLSDKPELHGHGRERFERSLSRTANQLELYQKRVEERLADGASLIFTAHLLLLKDEQFVGKMRGLIDTGADAATAIVSTADYFIRIFGDSEFDYMREKADDVRDLASRLLENLLPDNRRGAHYRDRVAVAREVLPSDVLIMAAEKVRGLVLVSGGVTSHIAILARSLKIPTIIADDDRLLDISMRTVLLLDGDTGNIYVNPDSEIIEPFERRNEAIEKGGDRSYKIKPRTFTQDRERITLLANVNLLSDAAVARKLKFEGIGLYRTEFPFLVRSTFPAEEEQFVVYRKLVENAPHALLTFRTLDIGGDKVLSYYRHHHESNPFLGMRSVRFTLENPDIFKQQIRAILRAGAGADLRIMFPMIGSIEELRAAKAAVRECIDQLREENTPHNEHPLIGMMVELPSVVPLIDLFAAESDFLSIGTNDLIQYMLAVDRTNEKVSRLYIPHHPAVLHALKTVTDAAHAHDIPISVCGDMGHASEYLPLLVGMGIRTISIDPVFMPTVQRMIETLSMRSARDLAHNALRCSTASEVEDLLNRR